MIPLILGTIGVLGGVFGLMDHSLDAEKKQIQAAQSRLTGLQGQLSNLQTQLQQSKSVYTTDQTKLAQQNQLQSQVSQLQQQVATAQVKLQQAQQLYQQAQTQFQQQQQLQSQIQSLQQQIQSAALKQGASSAASPDGYNQAQLSYLEAHQNLLPGGQIVAAQGGKLLLEAGNGHPIVVNIVGAKPSPGDPGFIVGNQWYSNAQQAQVASQQTGMPVNPAVAVDPTLFNQYTKPVNLASLPGYTGNLQPQSQSQSQSNYGSNRNRRRTVTVSTPGEAPQTAIVTTAQSLGIQPATQSQTQQALALAKANLANGSFTQAQYNRYTYDVTHQVVDAYGTGQLYQY